jgi:hypothetical protein
MFGSDLSFIPGLLGIFPRDYPWNAFSASTLWPLFTLNGFLPAMFIMFLCVLYLKKYYEDGRLSHIIVFALLGFSAYGFKSSVGPHIMGASFLTGVASVVFMNDKKKGKLLCAVSVLTILAIATDTILFRGGTGNNILSIELLNRFHNSLNRLGISDMSWFLYPVIFLLYILATFGIRALGFYALKGVVEKRYLDPTIVFLAIFVVSGFFLSEIIFLGPLVPPAFRVNDAMWFSLQSLMGAWLLLSYFLLRINRYGKGFLGAVVLIILLSAPSTVQFLLLRFNPTYYTIDSNAMEVVRYLETTPPSSVVLHPPNLDGPSFASNLTGRPSVLSFFQSYIIQNIGQQDADNRLKDVKLFFNLHEVINRSSILKKYKVDYVYAPLSSATTLDKESILLKVLENRGYVLYRVESNISL